MLRLATMANIDFEQRVIRLKLVYWGSQGSGKTANLSYVHLQTARTSEESAGGATEAPRSSVAHADYLPVRLGDIRGFSTFFDLYTVPGGEPHRDFRRTMLEGTDGVIFIADSRKGRIAANAAALTELNDALKSHRLSLTKLPFVVQCNHSDADDARSPAEVAAPLLAWHPAPAHIPVVVGSAPYGEGVFATLKAAAKLALTELRAASP
jgi:signal recognition particle receptor subunit beta